MGTKIKGTLPPYELNGIGEIRQQLLENPEGQHVAIVVLDCVSIKHDVVEGDLVPTPTIRLLRIEPETDPDQAAALMAWAKGLTDRRIPPPARPDPIPGLDLTDVPSGRPGALRSVGGDRA
ncbi:hypothetical protein [Micromonospora sp. RTGN7]|uniref:hypothetical protein n=1 Tax=Micromonospora sp. RTGN7 TaxID=3016526 RepID=UPI0029FF188D|nr:hypothetical protein [Micromonospora sp. RTGN7]